MYIFQYVQCIRFSRLVSDTLQGEFLSTSGFDGWVATTLCSGLIKSTLKDALRQSFLMGILRFGTWFTIKDFYNIIYKCNKRRNEGKKLDWKILWWPIKSDLDVIQLMSFEDISLPLNDFVIWKIINKVLYASGIWFRLLLLLVAKFSIKILL